MRTYALRIGCSHVLKSRSGLTLIEVLIALAVLSIGLAGLASMHFSSLQYVHSAYHRSLASTIALDFEERLWLELADPSLARCPDTGTGEESAAAALVVDWTRNSVGEVWEWSTADLIHISNLVVTTGTPVTTTLSTEIPVTLSWSENRFSDTEPTLEQFTYTVRIICRPDFSSEEASS